MPYICKKYIVMPKKVQPPQSLEFYAIETSSPVSNSFIGVVKAGFPSPAGDFINESIDLNDYVTSHPTNTFYAIARGISMEEDFRDGDLLVIDRLQDYTEGKIVVCYVDGEFTVKRIKIDEQGTWLIGSNKQFKPILVTQEDEFRIWGVVTHVIKTL
jgi:DNA polymerase V